MGLMRSASVAVVLIDAPFVRHAAAAPPDAAMAPREPRPGIWLPHGAAGHGDGAIRAPRPARTLWRGGFGASGDRVSDTELVAAAV